LILTSTDCEPAERRCCAVIVVGLSDSMGALQEAPPVQDAAHSDAERPRRSGAQ